MEQPSGAQVFGGQLRCLYEAAGSPLAATLIRTAKAQANVTINAKTFSDWINGKTVPSSAAAVEFLARYLQPIAQRRSGYQPRPLEWWKQQRARAWRATHTTRGGRPVARREQWLRARDDAGIAEQSAEGLGRVIGELTETDALALEVHRAVVVAGETADTPILPPYLLRPHDDELRAELRQAVGGSRVILLVGDSSTGKTRACWEAIREVLPGWRVWHPLTPERPHALVDALTSGRVVPRTVIWLNETQMYLDQAGVGERVASVLHDVLHRADVAPIVVLGSIWPKPHLHRLTDPGATQHAAARQLLTTAHKISVPPDFNGGQLAAMGDQIRADPRLRLAVDQARGRISQFLAGAPEQVARYDQADEPARAVVWAAMDAYRLGHGLALREDFLHDAAPAYLDRGVWDQTTDDWFPAALHYLTRPCHGAAGPLAPRRALPGEPAPEIPCYRLADYLDQIGRTTRGGVYPPGGFWDAATAHVTNPIDLGALAFAAERRGRYQRAVTLAERAADRGQTFFLRVVARARAASAGLNTAAGLYREAADRGDVVAVRELASLYEHAGDAHRAVALFREAADRGDTVALLHLATLREEAGDLHGAVALYREAAEGGDTAALRHLTCLREWAGDHDGATTFARQALDHGDTSALLTLAVLREQAGDPNRAAALYREAADRGHPSGLRELARLREKAGDLRGAATLYQEAINRGDIGGLQARARLRGRVLGLRRLTSRRIADLPTVADRTSAACELARLREQTGDREGAAALAMQALNYGDGSVLRTVARLREQAGDGDGATALARRGADRGDQSALRELAKLRERAGDRDGAAVLHQEAAGRGDLGALRELARLRDQGGDRDGAAALAMQAVDRGDGGVLVSVAVRRVEAGDRDGAIALARQGADHGDASALRVLATLREEGGDREGAASLYQEALDRGERGALGGLARLRMKAGDRTGAAAVTRFGLDDGGRILHGW